MSLTLAENTRTAVKAAIKRATKASQTSVDRLDVQGRRELSGIYRQAAADLTEMIRMHAGPDDNVALQEMRSLLDQVTARLAGLSRDRDDLLMTGLERAAAMGTEPFAAAGISVAASMRAADEALQFVRTFVANDGLQLSDRIWRIDRGAREAVTGAIERAVILGQGASQAAREFLSQGRPVPVEIQSKIDAANAGALGREMNSALLTGEGSPMDNAMRLFRTEINRAHGIAYINSGKELPDTAGYRYLLSPAHPRPDICDLLSRQNLFGLGPGVYPPDKIDDVWPAHPNTLSFVEIVFKDEITEEDRQGKETSMEALRRLTPEQQKGVLGVAKREVLRDGKLTTGMIRAPLSAVRRRVGDIIPPPQPRPLRPVRPARPRTLDDMIAAGARLSDELLPTRGEIDGAAVRGTLLERLQADRPISRPAKLANGGKGADLVIEASKLFPDDWTRAADAFGPLSARFDRGRGWHVSLLPTRAGTQVRIKSFGAISARGGDGFIAAGEISTAVHEYAHRLQHAIPELDDFFQDLHIRRTDGDAMKKLRDLQPGRGYGISEAAREDKYINPYQGKMYAGAGYTYLGKRGALEVMSMAFETVLGGPPSGLARLARGDREMFDLVVGLLFNYAP